MLSTPRAGQRCGDPKAPLEDVEDVGFARRAERRQDMRNPIPQKTVQLHRHHQPQPRQKHRHSQQTTSDKHVHCCQHYIFSTQHCYNTQKQLTWSSNWEPLTYEPVISRSLFIVAMNQSSAPAGWSKTTVRRREDGGGRFSVWFSSHQEEMPAKTILLTHNFGSCADTA